MSDLVNFIRFTETGLSGNIASMAYDIDLTGEEISSTNPKAPVYRLLARTPRARSVEIGGIWKKTNQTGGDYYTLSVSTGYGPRAGPYLDEPSATSRLKADGRTVFPKRT